MSVAEPPALTGTAGERRLLHGWGRTAPSWARVVRPANIDDAAAMLAACGPRDGGVIARGAGLSYGDAAQIAGGVVLDMTALTTVSVDAQRELVTAQAGATIAQILDHLAPHGLTLPVVPGTRHVTLGGAIASDVHGKNHRRDGSFARHVRAITLITPAAGIVQIAADVDGELFDATLGAMGLTGVVVEATLRAERQHAPWLLADIDRVDDLEAAVSLMSSDDRHRHSVAWIDLLAPGARLGRSVVTRADAWTIDHGAPPVKRALGRKPQGPMARQAALRVPPRVPAGILRPSAVRAFNRARWYAAPRCEHGRPLALAAHLFPLDALGGWNRLYGPAGLIQYQFVVPEGSEAALGEVVELLRHRRVPVYLAVLKRLGERARGPLSFPMAGWTLALDLPSAAPWLRSSLNDLDAIVAERGGRVYLTKDARLRPDLLDSMYPELEALGAVRARVDPERTLSSDLARRLGLCGVGS